jgi:hypothetical protein
MVHSSLSNMVLDQTNGRVRWFFPCGTEMSADAERCWNIKLVACIGCLVAVLRRDPRCYDRC